jgi:hypothetical protein
VVTRVRQSAPSEPFNAATRTVVSWLGVLLGISSISHGVLELMQGNVATPGLFVKALGPGHSWTLWVRGGEPAFTLLHNFLLTGTLATAIGVLIIIWSMMFIDRRGGATVFLLLSIGSFLAGGGQAQVLLFTLNWAAATRVRAPLAFWQWIMPKTLRRTLARVWRPALLATGILFLVALEIATFGYFPGLPHDTKALTRDLWRLAGAIIAAILVAIIAGFAHDLATRAITSGSPRYVPDRSVGRHD